MIRVIPTYAEYWDRSGLRKLELTWETGKALLQGKKADDQALSGHEKLNLGKEKSNKKNGEV
jgi:hypothetical protein